MGDRTIERSHLDAIGPDTPTTDLAKSLRFVAKWTLNPPHPVPLQEAARRLEQLVELEAIVRVLAEFDPAPRSNAYYCSMCGEETADDISLHTDGCAYARAVMWVSAHPVSGDQQ